jgi:hypothetical protein
VGGVMTTKKLSVNQPDDVNEFLAAEVHGRSFGKARETRPLLALLEITLAPAKKPRAAGRRTL